MIDINEVAFVDIDTQKDFMEKGGALYINSSEEIKENLKKLTEFAVKKKIIILCSVDAHTENDPEFSKFPPHCIRGKEGYEKIDETKVEKFIIVPYEKEFIPEVRDYHQIIFEKKTFSIFDNPNFLPFLKKIRKKKFFIYGVATEYCVKSAVEGFLKERYEVFLISDAIKAIDEKKGKEIIEEFKTRGVKIIKTEEVFTLFK